MLSPDRVKQYYDRFGSRQDSQGFYEDPALDDLLAHANVGDAGCVVEFGCGTGRLAQRMLEQAPTADYVGYDISTTMVTLARARLESAGSRVQVRQLEPGTVQLPLPSAAADRLVSTYVLDLLPESASRQFLAEARRVLQPGGLLCLVGITPGESVVSRVVMGLWQAVWRINPGIVGGCRPLQLRRLVESAPWSVVHARTVVSWGIASEVVIATAHSIASISRRK